VSRSSSLPTFAFVELAFKLFLLLQHPRLPGNGIGLLPRQQVGRLTLFECIFCLPPERPSCN